MQGWAEIEDRYDQGLVLGNGASIAFDGRFSYGSLRASAQASGLIEEPVQRVFEHLRTEDFELVLRMLWHASMINDALDVEDTRTSDAYRSVRKALISVVRMIHVPYEEVAERLPAAAQFMNRFQTIASLNYDLLVYWSFMAGMADGVVRFKDCFNSGELDQDWERFRKPLNGNPDPTLVFYPHGNLVLAMNVWGGERKVSASNASLLEAIFALWNSEEVGPMFVSEGTSEQKLASIRRSSYLSVVYDHVLPRLGDSVVFYGFSFGEYDDHLVEAIMRGRPERLAVAVDGALDELALQEVTATIHHKIEQHRHGDYAIEFFDWRKGGCWIAS